MKETYSTPDLLVTLLESADVLTASGEAYTGEGNYGEYESRDAGEFDDFDVDWG